MPKVEIDYTQTTIYKICCKDTLITDIYVGHTTNFTKRKNQHKTSCSNENDKKYKQYVYEFIRQNGGWENWTMLQIENIKLETEILRLKCQITDQNIAILKATILLDEVVEQYDN